MDKVTIGIANRISISVLERALLASLDGTASSEYFSEIANIECSGANRAKKIACLMNKLSTNNAIMPFIRERKDEFISSLRNPNDRTTVFVSILASSYSFFYDTISILGKYLHAQPQVGRTLIVQKLSEKYGSNRSLFNAFDCVMPMLIEAGIIERPSPGVYIKKKQERYSPFALQLYQQAYLLNNPGHSISEATESNPFFEFI